MGESVVSMGFTVEKHFLKDVATLRLVARFAKNLPLVHR
jgi:hypothetical protein